METKQIAAVVLILAVIAVAYYVLTLPQDGGNGIPAEYSPPFAEEGKNVTLDEFASSMLASSKIYVVEDIRGLEAYPISRKNIMQCGVDYAGSPGLVGKEFTVYVYDDGDLCGTLEGHKSISE